MSAPVENLVQRLRAKRNGCGIRTGGDGAEEREHRRERQPPTKAHRAILRRGRDLRPLVPSAYNPPVIL